MNKARRKMLQDIIDELDAQREQLQGITGQSWPKEDELRRLRTDLGILDRKINQEINNGKKQGSGSEGKPKESGTLADAA